MTAPLRRLTLSDWPVDERRAMTAAAIGLFGSFFISATWGCVILPVQRAFAMAVDGEILLRQLPDIAGLLMIPTIGAFGASVSSGRMLAAAACMATAGAVIATLAPTQGWLLAGLALMNVGRSVVGVAAFASVGEAITHEGRRTSAYAALGAVAPVAFITGPVLATWLSGMGSWRLVASCWIASGMLVASAAWLSRTAAARPAKVQRDARREPFTPLLAGLTLVGVVQSLGVMAVHGPGSGHAMAWMSGTLASGAAWFALSRVFRASTVGGRTLQVPGLWPILMVAMIGQCGDLWFYVAAIARFVHQLTPLQVSLSMLAAQFAGLLGAWAAAWLIHRVGLRLAGTLLMAAYAITMFASCAQTIDQPLWFAIAVLCVAAVAELGSGVCLSTAIMSCATQGLDRSVSSCRSAAMGIGNAITVLLVAASVSHAMATSIRLEAEARNVSPSSVEALAVAVRDNVPISKIGPELDLSPTLVQELRQVRRGVMVHGFQVHGWVSGTVLTVAAVGFWVVRRDARPAA